MIRPLQCKTEKISLHYTIKCPNKIQCRWISLIWFTLQKRDRLSSSSQFKTEHLKYHWIFLYNFQNNVNTFLIIFLEINLQHQLRFPGIYHQPPMKFLLLTINTRKPHLSLTNIWTHNVIFLKIPHSSIPKVTQLLIPIKTCVLIHWMLVSFIVSDMVTHY